MTKHKKLVLVGGGNMGEALVAGLMRSKQWKPFQVVVTDIRADQLAGLKKKYRVTTSSDNRWAVRDADLILLAVKPQHMAHLLEEIGPVLRQRQLVLSIAAGVTTARIEAYLAKGVPVVRVMPNTPALVGSGVSGMCLGRYAKAVHAQAARSILETVGTVEVVTEKEMDAVTAVSGSGPAYIFYVAEAMKEAGITLGLAPRVADHLVRRTIQGAGILLTQSHEEPSTLRARVTSPGGTTEAALKILEGAKLKSLFTKALSRARNRSVELSKGGK